MCVVVCPSCRCVDEQRDAKYWPKKCYSRRLGALTRDVLYSIYNEKV